MNRFELLRILYDDVVSWLKYAEAKNAALTALAAGSLYATTKLAALSDNQAVSAYIILICIFFVLSLLFSVISFVPITNPRFFQKKDLESDKNHLANIFFYNDLAKLSDSTLLSKLSDGGFEDSFDTELERQLASQVIVLSKLASRKLWFFELGAWLFTAGLLSPVAAFLIFWILGGPSRRIA